MSGPLMCTPPCPPCRHHVHQHQSPGDVEWAPPSGTHLRNPPWFIPWLIPADRLGPQAQRQQGQQLQGLPHSAAHLHMHNAAAAVPHTSGAWAVQCSPLQQGQHLLPSIHAWGNDDYCLSATRVPSPSPPLPRNHLHRPPPPPQSLPRLLLLLPFPPPRRPPRLPPLPPLRCHITYSPNTVAAPHLQTSRSGVRV